MSVACLYVYTLPNMQNSESLENKQATVAYVVGFSYLCTDIYINGLTLQPQANVLTCVKLHAGNNERVYPPQLLSLRSYQTPVGCKTLNLTIPSSSHIYNNPLQYFNCHFIFPVRLSFGVRLIHLLPTIAYRY